MVEGKVKWFNPRKGYGFIGTATAAISSCTTPVLPETASRRSVREIRCMFDIVEGEKGLRATNVVPKAPAEKQTSP